MAAALSEPRADWRLRRFRSAVPASVRMARARERLRSEHERDRLASIPALDLEPVLHAELLAQMAEVLAR